MMPRVLSPDERRLLLERLAENFPDAVSSSELGIEDTETLRATASYLEQHSLVKVRWIADGPGYSVPLSIALTATGYDMVEQDSIHEDD